MLFVRHNWTHPFYRLFLLLFRALNIYLVKLFSVTQLIGFLHVDIEFRRRKKNSNKELILAGTLASHLRGVINEKS